MKGGKDTKNEAPGGSGGKGVQRWTPGAPAAESGYIYGGPSRDEAGRDADDSQWAIPWADLMMTMFVMFAMMLIYVLSERDVTEAFHYEENASTAREAPKLENLSPDFPTEDQLEGTGLTPEEILQLAEHAANDTDIEDVQVLLQDDKTIKISLRGPLLFDLGSADLREGTKAFLKKVALVLNKTQNEVNVIGHTDTFPIHSDLFPTNWELSVGRASAVARYMIQVAQLEPGRFTIMGNSMYRPTLPNDSLENKQLNRRVEIIITKKIYEALPLE
jgi:chemotaxis protein MotB